MTYNVLKGPTMCLKLLTFCGGGDFGISVEMRALFSRGFYWRFPARLVKLPSTSGSEIPGGLWETVVSSFLQMSSCD